MGSQEEQLIRILQQLERYGVYATENFRKDILRIVGSDFKKFLSSLYKDILRKDMQYNRFKKLTLTDAQKRKLNGNLLYRYEYRNTSNLRCIYIVEKDHNNNTILLCAFNEDGDKQKGNSAYKVAIEKAIRIYKGID